MKKAILSVVTICAAAVLLVGQDSATQSTSRPSSRSASSKPASRAVVKADPAAKYKIAMKYQPGMKYEVVMTHKNDQSITVGDSTTKVQNSFIMKLYMDVQKTGDNGMTPVTISVGRCAQKMQYDGREDGFDSDDPDFGKGKGASVVELMSRRYPGVIGKDGLIGDGADGMRDRNELMCRVLNLPLSYARGEFSDIGEVWDGVNAEPFLMFARLLVGDGSDGDGQSPSEKFSLTLKEIIDSPAGKIAAINIKGVLMVAKEKYKRSGSIRFNMEKQIVEAIVIKTVIKDPVEEKFTMVDEVLIKPINEIPVHRLLLSASQPTSASVASQPAK